MRGRHAWSSAGAAIATRFPLKLSAAVLICGPGNRISVRRERDRDVQLLGRCAVAAGDGGAGDVVLAQRIAHRDSARVATDLTARRDEVSDPYDIVLDRWTINMPSTCGSECCRGNQGQPEGARQCERSLSVGNPAHLPRPLLRRVVLERPSRTFAGFLAF